MQAFYTSLFAHELLTARLMKVACASLKEILVVRSELAWAEWGETEA